jgi:hypothetical protein
VDPLKRKVTAYRWVRGKFKQIAEKGGAISSGVIAGFFVRPAWLFGEKLIKTSVALREMGVK